VRTPLAIPRSWLRGSRGIVAGRRDRVRGGAVAVAPGRITAFIGPSGCGKSTLLRAINRMNELLAGTRHEGDVRLFGKSVYAPAVDVVQLRRQIGMVFQKPNPFPKSIYENIAWTARIHGYKGNMNELVENSLRQAALWDEVKDKLHQSGLSLSGGQQQRVAIARALANEPAILLADEPTANLDTESSNQIVALFRELNEKGQTIIMVTHEPELGEKADRIIRIKDGRVVS